MCSTCGKIIECGCRPGSDAQCGDLLAGQYGMRSIETAHNGTASEPLYEEVWYVEDNGAADSRECAGAAALNAAGQEAYCDSAASASAGPGLGLSAAVPPPARARAGVDRRARPDARLPLRLAAADLRLRPGVDDESAAVLAWALGAAHLRPEWRMRTDARST